LLVVLEPPALFFGAAGGGTLNPDDLPEAGLPADRGIQVKLIMPQFHPVN